MNKPEYIVVDEMRTLIGKVKTALNLTVLNFQHGYVRDLKQRLTAMSKTVVDDALKFPCVWMVEPFIEVLGTPGYYSTVQRLYFYLMTGTDKNHTPDERMDKSYKLILLPIYREMITQLVLSKVFSVPNRETFEHQRTIQYFWGHEQQTAVPDIVDCLEIYIPNIKVNNNLNC